MRLIRLYIIIAIVCAATIGIIYDALYMPDASIVDQEIAIQPNTSATVIADTLRRAGIIRNILEFRLALKVLGKENALLPGVYEFKAHASNKDIINALTHVRTSRHTFVTFPEGLTSYEFAHIAKDNLGIDSVRFIALVRDSSFIYAAGLHALSLEGYLFPETYEFDLPVKERDILTRMVTATKRALTDSVVRRCKSLGVTVEEMLTLASIVEAEAAMDVERPRIAGVYWNRLHARMRLEADPTIQYAIGERRHLYYKDLDVPSPFNTYRNYGLPPTPINNPGIASIEATLYPEQNSYLYFVARGDIHGFTDFHIRWTNNTSRLSIIVNLSASNHNESVFFAVNATIIFLRLSVYKFKINHF